MLHNNRNKATSLKSAIPAASNRVLRRFLPSVPVVAVKEVALKLLALIPRGKPRGFSLRNCKKGTIIPLIAVTITVLIGMGSLVIDLSNSYVNQTKVKNAIDFSTLAGASQLNGTLPGISNAKNVALNYLNENLTATLSSFNSLTFNSAGLSIQAGIYDFINMTFTLDEVSPNVNALRISYSYESMSFLSPILMLSNIINVGDSAISVKQAAGQLAPGGGFPIVIDTMALSEASMNSYMVDLIQSGENSNSYFTAFSNQNANANDINNILSYLGDPSTGTKPPAISINDNFQINANSGQLGSAYMILNSNTYEGMVFVASVGTPTMSDTIDVNAFVGIVIDDVYQNMGDWHISISILPGYVDNTRSGLNLGLAPTNIDPNFQSLLANSFGLVQ